jgi:D-methionine transport system permease protein
VFDFLGANAWMADRVLLATWESIYMVVISTFLSYLVGLPLGVNSRAKAGQALLSDFC